MTVTNFPNGASSFGIPLLGGGGLPATKGTTFFVDAGDGKDSDIGTEIGKPFKTLEYALTRCTSNAYDVIALIGNTTHDLAAMLTVDINRLTIIGLDGSPGRRYGQRSKVSLGVTAVVTDIATMINTGVGNVFSNIKFIDDNTVNESLYCVIEGGEYAQYNSCEMYKSDQMDDADAAELCCNGDSAEFNNCFIGSTTTATVGAIIRPCVTLTPELAGSGLYAVDVSFRNCIFARNCGNVANNFIYGLGADSVKRMLLLENCILWNNLSAAAVMAEAIEFGSDQTEGSVLLKNTTAINVTGIASTGQGVYSSENAEAAATSSIALALA